MTGKEYSESIEFTKLTPDKYGNYHLPIDFIRRLVSTAFIDGKCEGIKESFDVVKAALRKGTEDVISQS